MNRELLLKHYDRISEAPDAIPRLRRFILDLAVRGKLVEQDPRDEPASELLKRIREKVKKGLSLQTVSVEDLLFELPSGWVVARFGDVFSLEYGDNLPAEKRSNTGEYPVYGSNGVVGSHFEAFVSSPCLVVGRKGSAGALNLSLTDGCCVTDVAYYCIPPNGLDLAFSFKMFHTLGLDALGKGVKPGLSRNEAYVLPLPLPPLAEQQRIVAKVDELMALCDQLEAARNEREARRQRLTAASLQRLNQPADAAALRADARFYLDNLTRLTTRPEQIKQLRQTILNLAVRGCLVPQDPKDEPASELLKRIQAEKAIGKNIKTPAENPSEALPVGWNAANLSDYALDVCTGPFGSALHQSDYINEGIPLVNPSHMINDRIISDDRVSVPLDIAERLSSYRLEPGDVVMARRGEVGRAALVEPHQKGWLCGTGSFYLRFSQEINRHYFLLLLRSTQLRAYLAGKAVGTTMVNLNHNILNKARLQIPPLAEQHRIVARVDELMALCDQLEAQLTATATDSRRLLEAVLRDALHPAEARGA